MDASHRVHEVLTSVKIDIEFDAATDNAAVRDHSNFGIVEVTGRDRLDLLHRLSTNDLLAAKPGQAVASVFTTDKGRIVDYVRVLVRDSSLIILTSPGNEEAFVQWIEKFCIMEDIIVTSVTYDYGASSVIGPRSHSIISQVFDVPLRSVGFTEIAGRFGRLVICTNEEFGTSTVDIIVPRDHMNQFREYLLIETEKEGVIQMHDETYEAFRISRGIPKFGCELSESYNPYEAALLHAISFTKGCYIGQEVIARLNTYQKVQRSLIGLILSSVPHRQGQRPIIRHEGNEIGWLTSVSAVPIHGKTTGLGIVKKDLVIQGTMVSIDDTRSIVTARVSNLPMELRAPAYD